LTLGDENVGNFVGEEIVGCPEGSMVTGAEDGLLVGQLLHETGQSLKNVPLEHRASGLFAANKHAVVVWSTQAVSEGHCDGKLEGSIVGSEILGSNDGETVGMVHRLQVIMHILPLVSYRSPSPARENSHPNIVIRYRQFPSVPSVIIKTSEAFTSSSMHGVGA